MEITGRTFVVTGGGNGIGRQVVLELLLRGAKVAALDIRDESLAGTAELAGVGDRLATFALDITDREATAASVDHVVGSLGSPDGLINVAGIIQPFVRINDLDWETIDRVVDVNLYGTLHMIKAYLPLLVERPAAHITNVSSMGGFLPVPGQSIYGATKAAVKLLSEGLYAELRDTNVGVSVVMPGGVSTEITTNSGVEVPAGAGSAEESRLPTTTPEDAARTICDGIADDKLHIYVGKDSVAMNIATRVAPKQATHLIQRQMKALLS
jgi:NAD(P)-dependent dehydrogenase (short-subunit alcohol dehydrogenase family)